MLRGIGCLACPTSNGMSVLRNLGSFLLQWRNVNNEGKNYLAL